jgi:hypothetical protein
MWERPQAHLLLAYGPQLGQSMGLDDQEPHNQGAENHQLGMRNAGRGNFQSKRPNPEQAETGSRQ